MKLKTKPERFMLQIGNFVYDYKKDKGVEKIIVAFSNDLHYYSVYDFVNDNIVLTFTNMSNTDIEKYKSDLYRNYKGWLTYPLCFSIGVSVSSNLVSYT